MHLLSLLPQQPADCLLLDLNMPGRNGLDEYLDLGLQAAYVRDELF